MNEIVDLNVLAYQKVKSHGIVPFREITMVLGRTFHLSRKQTFVLLRVWQSKDWVKIHPYHGVRFLRDFNDKKELQ